MMRYFLTTLCLFSALAFAQGPTPGNVGTAENDEAYLDEEATRNKLENESRHQQNQEMEIDDQKDIDAMKYDPYMDSDIPSKDGKVRNKDPRE